MEGVETVVCSCSPLLDNCQTVVSPAPMLRSFPNETEAERPSRRLVRRLEASREREPCAGRRLRESGPGKLLQAGLSDQGGGRARFRRVTLRNGTGFTRTQPACS